LEKKNFRIKFNDFTSHSSIDENDEIQKNKEVNITEKIWHFLVREEFTNRNN